MDSKELKLTKNKSKSKKSSSKEKAIHPFVVTNTNSTSYIVNPNNKNNDKDDKKDKKDKKEKILEKKKEETKKEIIKSFDNLSPFNDLYEYDSLDFSKKSSSNDHISLSINKLSKGDDMDILNELMSLCNFLSLSNERIGYNSNIGKLLDEICKNLTKTYLPEIIIYSLQCINYILDINPTLSYVLKKVNAVSSIMKTISSLEDISCIEYIIKIFDKISTQNSRILLENNVFESLLVNIFDFLNIYQKKSLIKICHNITLRRINREEYNTYIKPAMNVLINLIRVEDDDNNDNLFIAEKAMNILYNIINYNKYGDSLSINEKKDENILTEIISNYKIIESFIDILNKYFFKNNQIITEQLIRNILRTIVLILEISKEGMDKILSNNFLEIIADVINSEFNTEAKIDKNNNNIIINRRKNSNINCKRGLYFLPEFFDILIALFPSWKYADENNKKILNSNNKKYFDYFCKNIFLPLINNITNKSTNKIIINLIKLILAFINNTNKKDVILFLPSKPISQIIIKLLETKTNNNIIDALSLIKSLLEKVPEDYIVNFVREGIVHNLKNFKFESPKKEKNDIINLNLYEKKIPKLYPLNLHKKKERSFYKKEKEKEKEKEIDKDKEKEKEKDKKDIINKKEESDFLYEFEEKEKEKKYINLFNNDDFEKNIEKEKEKEKEKNNEENSTSFIKKIISNSPKEKMDVLGLLPLSESFNEENDMKYSSEVDNEEEDDQENEEMINNEESENEEKEEDEQDQENEQEQEQEQEENINLLSKKKSILLNSSYSEDKDKEEDIIDNNIKKEKEKEKNDENFNFEYFPLLSNSKLPIIKEKPYTNIFEEELSKSFFNKNNNDIIMKDISLDNKSEKEEKIKIEKKIIENINENENKNDEIKKEEKNKLDTTKKHLSMFNEEPKGLVRKSRLKDYIRNKIKYNELEDSLVDIEKKAIQEKIKDLLDNYLTDEKIAKYLSNTKDNLIKIQATLSNYKQLLSSNEENEVKNKYIKEIVNILTDENISITLFELENSNILLSLCNYLEPEFNSQYNKLKDDNEFVTINDLINNLSDKYLIPKKINYNNQIFERISNFLENFEGNKNKMTNFIKLLNESIQGMNSPIFLLTDNKKSIISRIPLATRRSQNFKLKMDYDEQIFKNEVLNGNYIIDSNYKTKLCEINMFFRTNKRMILIINDKSTFKHMTINLLSIANIPLIANDKYDICLKYYIPNKNKIPNEKKDIDKMEIEEINDDKEIQKEEIINISNIETNNEQKKENFYEIDENWNYKSFIENYSKNHNNEIPNLFQFGLSIKLKNNEQKSTTNNNNSNIQIEKVENDSDYNDKSNGFLDYYSPFITDTINFENQINFDKYCFIKDYHDNIIYGKSIYFSKRLMPSLYLLSLLNICINKYNELFNLPKIWFINNDKTKKEWKKLFYNLKIDQFILKISLDPYKVSKTSFPFLGELVTNDNQTLTRFHTRFISFKTSFTSSYKSLINLQNHLKHNNPNYNSKYSVTLKKTMRLKINVERDKIIEHGFNILNDEITSKFRGFLEFEYNGEIGNGLGPTLEFYTLIIEKITEEKDLWYKTTDGSLYPRLLNDNENNDKILNLFKLLGYMIGRAIYDDRLLDIPLSKVFWSLVLDKPLLFKNIKIIDTNLYKTLEDFINLINKKKEYIKNNNIENCENYNFDDKILYNNCKLSELDIYFIFPGYFNIELKPNGNDILLTINNIEEYVNLIYDYLFYKGIDKIVRSFKEGFNMNFNIEKLKCFTSSEIEEYVCGSIDQKWDRNNLFENLKPEHGYTSQSRTFNDLIKFMCTLNKNQRKKFLIFSTGCSRLPIGGFKSLSPKLTVVKKHCEEGHDPDDYLPTVMTCQNYLKLPEYSNYNILEQKILLAMKEGCNEFNLS